MYFWSILLTKIITEIYDFKTEKLEMILHIKQGCVSASTFLN